MPEAILFGAMKTNITLIFIFLGLVTWQCTKIDSSDRKLSLKESLEESIAKINTALDKISVSNGYKLLSVTEEGAKSDDIFYDSIDLKLIAGIYKFQPDTVLRHHFYFPYKLFKKTGTSDQLIINLPEKMVFHPKKLHLYKLKDPVEKNNFKITASEYHFYYNWWNNFDYKLFADLALNSEDIGSMSILSRGKPLSGSKYSAKYAFPEGYSITKFGQTGDTTRMSFALSEDKDTLLMETIMFLGDGFKRKEKQYILTVGNVDIKRSTGIDSIQVFLDGVLQKKAGARIIDNTDYNSSICYKRDILLTFDDGTTAKLSELINPAHETLKTLVKSLGEMYFAKHIVDYIALNIYYNSR